MIEIATAINSFASTAMQADFVPPSVTIPASLLQELLGAIQGLKEEVAALRDERDQDRQELAALSLKLATTEQWQGTLSDNQYHQLKLINSLREDAHHAPGNAAAPAPTQKTQDHITSIAVILGAKEKRLIEGQAPRAYVDRLRKEGLTFSELANVMGLTVDRIRQLAKIASGDQRFNITWHPRKKNTKIIKLRRWDALFL